METRAGIDKQILNLFRRHKVRVSLNPDSVWVSVEAVQRKSKVDGDKLDKLMVEREMKRGEVL